MLASGRLPLVVMFLIGLLFVSAFLVRDCVRAQTVSDSTNNASKSLPVSPSYKITVSYQIIGRGSPSAPTINYVDVKGNHLKQAVPLSPKTLTLTLGKNQPWQVTPNPLSSSTSSERWYSTNTLTGTSPSSGSATYTFTFQHQYYLTVSSPYGTATGSGWYNKGSTAYAALSQGTVQGATGTRYMFTGWSDAASGTTLTSSAINMVSAKTATANWKTQYQVTLSVNPSSAGTTTPSGTNYYDCGTFMSIKAASNDGAIFSSWSQTGNIKLTNKASSASTAKINGPGTLTANFVYQQKTTCLTVTFSPTKVDSTKSQCTIISGILTCPNNDVCGETITLCYCPVASQYSWTTIGSTTTSTKGAYQYQWTPTIENGAYFIKAEFAGDRNYKSSTAMTSCSDLSLIVLPEYLYGALAAIFACFGALTVYIRMIRTPKGADLNT